MSLTAGHGGGVGRGGDRALPRRELWEGEGLTGGGKGVGVARGEKQRPLERTHNGREEKITIE